MAKSTTRAGRLPRQLASNAIRDCPAILLHEHHLRAVGVDPNREKITNRLARAPRNANLP